MALSEKEVRHVAMLSRLALSDEEIQTYTGQLGKILSYIEKLDELDTSNIEPMITAVSKGNVFRADEVKDGLSREQALSSAPDHDDVYFRVPPVLD